MITATEKYNNFPSASGEVGPSKRLGRVVRIGEIIPMVLAEMVTKYKERPEAQR